MLTFQVANILGCKQAAVTLKTITALCGKNYQGKTSFARAVYAAVAGDKMIFPKLPQASAPFLVHNDADMGMVSVSDGENGISVSYPTLAVKTTGGKPPQASAVAMGFKSIADMPDKERYAYCAEVFGITPTVEELTHAVKEANLTPENIDALWKKIQAYGWDSVHKDTTAKGSELKGAWQHATGEAKYGTVKGAGSIPATWIADLVNATKETLDAELSSAEEWVIAAAKDDAVNTAERERLDRLLDEYIPFRAELKAAKQEYEKLDTLHQKGIAELKKYSGNAPDAMNCPHCKKQFILTEKGPVIFTEESAKKSTDDLAMYNSVIAANELLSAEKETAKLAISDLAAKVKELDAATVRLAELGKDTQTVDPNPIDVRDVPQATPEQRLLSAKERLLAFTAKTEADKYHRAIIRNDILIKALAPEGVRAVALAKALTRANELLAELSRFSGWPVVTLTEDLEIMYGERRFPMCSESEQFRARVMLQYLIARAEAAPFVMIDRADVLDTTGRTQLFKLAYKTEIPTLVLMTMNAASDAPDLARIGGETYWIDGGVTAKM